jgi:hypothetical protein
MAGIFNARLSETGFCRASGIDGGVEGFGLAGRFGLGRTPTFGAAATRE